MKEILLRIEIKQDKLIDKIHSIDKRLVRNETKIKFMFPILTLFLVSIVDFIKSKFNV